MQTALFYEDGFQLSAERPKPATLGNSPESKAQQRVLFCGLDCLPGQLDLFATDGEATSEEMP